MAVTADAANQIKTRILQAGIAGTEGQWQLPLNDLRHSIDTLVQKPNLSLADTRPPETSAEYFQCVCACGDQLGASYYAVRHNTHRNIDEVSYVIHLCVPLARVYVDGRDFLYRCFQACDAGNSANLKIQRSTLMRLYGERIAQYFDKATLSKDQNYRIALCDLACQDIEIVKSHSKNKIAICGRHNVVFSSAFLVKAPIAPTEIVEVNVARDLGFQPHLTLDDFLKGRVNLTTMRRHSSA